MSKIAIVFWSGSGNTEKMADCIAEGAKNAGAEVDVMGWGDFSADKFAEYKAVAFGCSSQGSEQLEESEVEPKWTELEASLSGKKIALFGSYGWGDGQWMRDWCERANAAGATLNEENGTICNESPSEDAQEECRDLGKSLANW